MHRLPSSNQSIFPGISIELAFMHRLPSSNSYRVAALATAIWALVHGVGGVGLEATLIAVDNSGYMINSDHRPSRLQSQYECVNLVCQVKTQNPENTIGLLTMGCQSDSDCPHVHVTPATNQHSGPVLISMVLHHPPACHKL